MLEYTLFFMFLFKKQVGESTVTSAELPPITDDGEFVLKPIAVLETRWVRKGSTFVEELLVQWEHLSKEDATWENAQELRDKFLSFNLEDKVLIQDRGNDKPRRSNRVPIKNPRYEGWAGTRIMRIQLWAIADFV